MSYLRKVQSETGSSHLGFRGKIEVMAPIQIHFFPSLNFFRPCPGFVRTCSCDLYFKILWGSVYFVVIRTKEAQVCMHWFVRCALRDQIGYVPGGAVGFKQEILGNGKTK